MSGIAGRFLLRFRLTDSRGNQLLPRQFAEWLRRPTVENYHFQR